MPLPPVAHAVNASLRDSWRELVVTDLCFKLLAFTVLTPIFSLLFQALLWASGNEVLSDVDIAMFFTGPFGWLTATLVGGLWLGISALEQVALMSILAAKGQGGAIGVWGSLLFAFRHAISVLRITIRIVAWTLIIVLPFALAAFYVYRRLLGEFDINYYLQQQPREFKIAIGIGVVLGLALFALLVRFYSNCFVALQLVVFEKIDARVALRSSRTAVTRNRVRVIVWVLGWLATMVALNSFVSFCVGWSGQYIVPQSAEALSLLAARVGLMLALLAISSLLVNVGSTCLLAAVLFNGYKQLRPDSSQSLARLDLEPNHLADSRGFITRKKVAIACLISVPAAAAIGFAAINSFRVEDDVEVMAHRGASSSAPENTIAAFQSAIENGADWIELDVQEDADGRVVVLHDSDFMKLADNPLKIWNASDSDLRDVDIGSWFDSAFSSERVPTLADVLAMCKNKIGVIIELKYYGHDQALEEKVARIVENLDMAKQVMVMSLKPNRVAKFKTLEPDWPCGVLMSVSVGDIQKFDVEFLAVNASFASRHFVNRVHKAGKKIFVWTVNDPATMSTMMNRGVDGILTDRPELAKQVLATRQNMSSSERLLTEIAALFGTTPKIAEQ